MTQPSVKILGPDGSELPPSRPQRALALGLNGYTGASLTDTDLASWTPFNLSGAGAMSGAREMLVSRIHDFARNDGWASGGLTRHVDAVVGAGWWLTSQPNTVTLGISDEAGAELAQSIEAAWTDYADDPSGDNLCDAARRNNVGGLLALAIRHRLMDGEALGVNLWRPGRGKYATCLQIIDPDRLSQPRQYFNSDTIFDGVEQGPDGEPVAYHIRVSHPGDVLVPRRNTLRWERVTRFTSFGRRNVLHAFEAKRAGDVRGEPLLAPVVKKLRMLGRYDEAELQAAVLNAVMAAFIETPFDADQFATAMSGGDELSKYQEGRVDFYADAPIRMPGVKVNFTYPGEKVTLTQPTHPNSVFEPFVRASLRNIASAMGLTYEQLSNDWGQVNYSSARAALIEVWRGFVARKEHFAQQFVQPFYSAWLEEAIDIGAIKLPKGAPKFRDAKAAYCAASWIGPGRGWVDPEKEARAALLRIAGGLSTYQRECAEQGLDYRDVIKQRQRERREMSAAGIDADAALAVVGKMPPAPADNEKQAAA